MLSPFLVLPLCLFGAGSVFGPLNELGPEVCLQPLPFLLCIVSLVSCLSVMTRLESLYRLPLRGLSLGIQLPPVSWRGSFLLPFPSFLPLFPFLLSLLPAFTQQALIRMGLVKCIYISPCTLRGSRTKLIFPHPQPAFVAPGQFCFLHHLPLSRVRASSVILKCPLPTVAHI